MTELGQMLKEARLKKGLTLDDIHKQTKIQKRYLEAIEEGNLDALPGHFYARAFVKSYAEAVDLPHDTVMQFLQTEPPRMEPVEEPVKPLRRERQMKSGQSSRWLSKVLLYSFAVLILFVIYIAISEYDKNPKPSAEPAPGSAAVKPPAVDGKAGATPPAANTGTNNTSGAAPTQGQAPVPATTPTPAPKPQVALSLIGQEGNVFHYEVSGVTDMNVKLTAVGDCWMRVQKGGQNGEKVEEVTLTNGMSKQYSFGSQDAWIRMGSAPDVTIEVNGVALDTSKMARASQIIWISIKK